MKRKCTRLLPGLLCALLVLSCIVLPMPAQAAPAAESFTFFEDSFEAYEANSAIPTGEIYAGVTGTIIDSGDSGHGKVLEASGAGNPCLTMNVGKADKAVVFDFMFCEGSNLGSWGGLYAKPYYGGPDQDIYAVISPATSIGGVRLSSGVEAGGFASQSCSYTIGAWYTVKLKIAGSTLYMKYWPAEESEPDAWTVHGTSQMATVDEGSQVVIQFVNGDGNATFRLDNLRIEFDEDPNAEDCTIEVMCDEEIGTVTGAGTYKKGDTVTLTAAVNADYAASYQFHEWRKNGKRVSGDAAYSFTVEAGGTYEAVFHTIGEPQYTYYTDDFEGYAVGEANKQTMPANYIDFADVGNYKIAYTDGGQQNKALTANTWTAGDTNIFFMDCEIIDKEVSFDFCYDKDFTSYGGVYVKLHVQPSKSDPAGDRYYFSMNPNFQNTLIVSCNRDNLGYGSYSYSKDTWYSVKGQISNDEIRIKIWPKDTEEPEAWTFSNPLGGFTPVAEGSMFGMEFFDVASNDIHVSIDNIVMKTWRKLPEKAQYTVTVESADTATGSVSGGGVYLDGNQATVKATPASGYSFVCWQDENGETVSTSASYTFTVTRDVTLKAVFELTPVVVRSFMAEGLTQTAEIDETAKTVTVRFASDTDLANVYPYFYLDAGVEASKECYKRMDLSSGTATIGEGDQQWTIYATKNSVMQNYYVNINTGSDSNDGLSPETAFKTLQKAKEAVAAIDNWTGDVLVNVACGEYVLDQTLEFTPEDSAAKGYAVIWKGNETNANDVVISSGRHLDGEWVVSSDVTGLKDGLTAWEYDASDLPYSRDLYVNGSLAQLAIYVLDEAAIGSWSLTDIAEMSRTGTGYTVSGKLANMAQWRNPSDIEFVYEVGWTYSILPVASISGNTVTMKADAFQCALRKAGVQINDPNFIQNCFEGLDSQGEWYFDRAAGKIYYISGADGNPNEMDMVMPTLDQLITVDGNAAGADKGAEWIYGLTFKDMTFSYTSYLRPHTYGQVEAQASYILNLDSINWDYFHTHDYYLKTDGGITVSYAEAMRVSGCIFTNMSGSGFDFEEGCRSCQFVGNNVTDICGNGMTIGGVSVRDAQPYSEYTYVNGVLKKVGADPDRVTKHTLVLSNRFQRTGLRYTGSVGIFAGYVSDTTIAHNTITDAAYSGISIGWGWGYWDGNGQCRSDQDAYNTNSALDSYHVFDTPSIQARYVVENNDISYVCQRLADGGAVYALSNQPGSKLNGNYMHDNPVVFGGVYFDEATGGFTEIKDNILYNVHTIYNYHLVGGLTDRQQAMHDLMYSGLNYLGVAPTDDSADAHYSEIVENSGCLSQIMPPEIDKQARVYTAEVVAPTCTEKGYTKHTCSICGDSWTDSETEATGHSFTQYVYNHDATTSADGTETAKCDYCDATDTRVKEGSKLEQPVEPGKPVYPVVPVRPSAPQTPSASTHFIDVKAGDWFYSDVCYVYENGLMGGTGDRVFSPDQTLTRGMLATILYRMQGEPSTAYAGLFTDVSDGAWYASAVEWAAGKGIVNGFGDGRFGPNDPITREQLAAILFRYAKANGMDVSAATELSGFTDGNEVSAYALDAMRWAVAEGLISGSGSKLLPGADANRAQIAAIIHRFITLAA